ncbi:MAG TPA: D-Ala-D-Ala carboxypeptidase family metallohydrolase [Gemmatimonadaceae bacterium]
MKTSISEFRHIPLVAAVVVMGATAPSAPAHTTSATEAPVAKAPVAIDSTRSTRVWIRDTLAGKSGKLWMKLLTAQPGDTTGILARLFGDSAIRNPGVYEARDAASSTAFQFVHLVPFSEKKRGMIGTYRMGSWPAERQQVSDRYGNPAGFIEVTPDNQNTRISEHFRLRDFLTKDQTNVWPKYLVLQESLIDKLELVIDALNARGMRVSRMSVMSGFRTPQYNDRGVGAGGRASNSRHQYGDAADVYVDNDGNGGMDDLNGDGRVNTNDARFLAQIVEDVERAHPDLVGGVGIYAANSAHGPFVHVDVRGTKARW